MSVAAARTFSAGTSSNHPDPRARIVVRAVLGVVATLGVALVGGSVLPSANLAGRLAGGGAFTQDLVAHFGERLRLSGSLLLLLVAGLCGVRFALQDLVGSALREFSGGLRWPSRTTLMAFGAPMLVAIGLRIAFLGQPMRYDEALSFNEFVSRPLYYGLSFYPDPNNHLLNTLLVHAAFVVFGNQPWVLRLPAFAGGVLLVPAAYVLGRVLYGSRAGLLSALLVAVSSYLVEYSTNSRGYTLQALCFVVMLSLAIVAIRRDSPSALLLAALVAAVGAYALPTMLYGVVVVFGWLAWQIRGRDLKHIGAGHLAASALLTGVSVGLLYLPVLIVSGADKLAANRFVVALDPAELASELPRSLARTWGFWNRDVPLPIAALLLVGFAVASQADLRQRRVPLGLFAGAVCVGLVVIQRVAPFERVWLFLLPLYLCTAAGGLAKYVDGRVLGVGLGVVLGFVTLTSGSILTSQETGAFPDAEAVSRTLSGLLAADDAVVTTLPASLPELQYYFPRAGLSIETLVREPQAAQHVYVVAAPDVTPQVAGWGQPQLVDRYAGSALWELRRPFS